MKTIHNPITGKHYPVKKKVIGGLPADQIKGLWTQHKAQQEALKSTKIRISVSCGHSTGYVEEYWIEDMEGNVIKPWNFPDEWKGKVFQLVEENNEDSARNNE